MHLAQITNVGFGYGARTLFNALSLDVRQGECVLISGPNGSGKTTLLKILHGDIRPQRGRIELFGRAVEDYSSRSLERVAPLLDQQPMLADGLSAIENLVGQNVVHNDTVRFLFSNRRKSLEQFLPYYTELAESVGLKAEPSAKAGTLSFGQQRLLCLMRTLVRTSQDDVKLLLLDEPLAGLSKDNCERVVSVLAEFKNAGWGIVLVEHLVAARALADFVLDIERAV